MSINAWRSGYRIHVPQLLGAVLAFTALVLGEATADSTAVRGETTLVSVHSNGTQANGFSDFAEISADGRFVVFESAASNLVAGDTNDQLDIFVHDRQTGQTTRLSVASDGSEANHYSGNPTISADGRYVAFDSWASNLVDDDTEGWSDVFVHDRRTGKTTRVSVASDGTGANFNSYSPALSADGRFVAFASHADNLVGDDTNGSGDIFVHDRRTRQTVRVSVATGGVQANALSFSPAISGDGRFVAFNSHAKNLVADDTNDTVDVFVHDRQTGQTTRVSVATDGGQANNYSFLPQLSADGRHVTFGSVASNLVADTNGAGDIFVHDRKTGRTERISLATGGAQANDFSFSPAISADGRYVAFSSFASNLVVDDTNDAPDVFVHDRQSGKTTRASVANNGTQGDNSSVYPAISADGRFVAFSSAARNLVVDDTNSEVDIFVRDRLFPAKVHIHPRSLSRRSRGKPLMAYLSLPECCSIYDIAPETVKLTKINGVAVTSDLAAFRSDVQGSHLLMVQFSRETLISELASHSPGELELTIEGELKDGAAFFATDWIYVVN
jgi:Tol biopolymer transport system component